jgi:uncharacterized repeat protein (TIGR02543 family)
MKKFIIPLLTVVMVVSIILAGCVPATPPEGPETSEPPPGPEEQPPETSELEPTPTTEVTYTVSVTTNPRGGGTISLSPAGGTYDCGTEVMLTAVPAQGYTFDQWSGDATGMSSSVTLTMDSAKTVIAHFQAEVCLTIWVIPEGSGSVTPGYHTCYEPGAEVTLSAIPAEGYAFDHWHGGATGTSSSLTLTMDTSMGVTAFFTAEEPPTALPKPGEWRASTGSSQFTLFVLTVNPNSTEITQIDYHFDEFKCGGCQSNLMAFYEREPIPIHPLPSGTEFTVDVELETVLLPCCWHMYIHGIFDETGTHASGSWEISAEGTICAEGTWSASAP